MPAIVWRILSCCENPLDSYLEQRHSYLEGHSPRRFFFSIYVKYILQGLVQELSDMQCGTKMDVVTVNVFCYADGKDCVSHLENQGSSIGGGTGW
jgi:hypothetical protein